MEPTDRPAAGRRESDASGSGEAQRIGGLPDGAARQATLERLEELLRQSSAAQQRLGRRLGWTGAALVLVLAGGVLLLALRPGWRGVATGPGDGPGAAGRHAAGNEVSRADGDGRMAELVSLRERVAELGTERGRLEDQLHAQATLAEKLRRELAAKGAALDDALDRLEVLAKTAEEEAAATREAGFRSLEEKPARLTRDPLVEAINLLFMEGGLLTYRLLHVDRVDRDERRLEGTIWSLCNDRGTAVGAVHANRCRFRIDPVARAVQVVLEDGYVTQSGEKRPFDGGTLGFAIARVDAGRWADLLDGVATVEAEPGVGDATASVAGGTDGEETGAAEDAGGTADGLDPAELERTAGELRALLAPEGYDVVALRQVVGGVLRDLRVETTSPSGNVKAIEASTCQIFRVQPTGYVELLFRGGFVEDRGGQRPFVGESYRLPLPGVDGARWKARLGHLVVDRG